MDWNRPNTTRLDDRRYKSEISPGVNPQHQYTYSDIVCVWLSGTVQSRYQFQARITTRPSRLRIAGRSPGFLSQAPIEPTVTARDALSALVNQLTESGWEEVETPDRKHWYSRTFRRIRDEA